jgi:hypothetical protein
MASLESMVTPNCMVNKKVNKNALKNFPIRITFYFFKPFQDSTYSTTIFLMNISWTSCSWVDSSHLGLLTRVIFRITLDSQKIVTHWLLSESLTPVRVNDSTRYNTANYSSWCRWVSWTTTLHTSSRSRQRPLEIKMMRIYSLGWTR